MKIVQILWKRWLKIAKIIGNFQGQVILTVFYLLFFWLLALPLQIFFDPLNLKNKRKTGFSKWLQIKDNLTSARKQF